MEVTTHGVALRATFQSVCVPFPCAGQGVGTSPHSMQAEETLSLHQL